MDNANGSGGVLLNFDANPFTKPVAESFDGASILDRISAFIRRYVYLSDAQARLNSVWVAHTHAIESSTTTPYISVTSAVKQSGKTRLLECFDLLVARPWLTGRITAACLVRKVDQVRPTLLLDESDAAFGGDKEYAEALRGILNTGFYAGGVASCCVGQGTNITFKDFKTFCAKAIAGIGTLPDTVQDRSIPIRLQRKRPGETVARFRKRHAKSEAAAIKSETSDWMQSIADQLRDAEPRLPDELTDRQQDGMEPLLAIADNAGGDWPEAVRRAAVEIFWSSAAADQNVAVQLLADIRAILQSIDDDKIASADLLAKLKEIETSPWSDWNKGKGLSTNGLARLLKPFGISPKGTIRVEDRTAKGYSWDSFQDAFSRYLPSVALKPDSQPSQASQPACLLTETHFSEPSQLPSVTVAKSASNPHEHCIVTDVTDGIRDTGRKKGKTLPSCPVCGSFALYREQSGVVTCQTCVARDAN